MIMNENLDFNLSFKDINCVNKLMKEFILDRKNFYKSVFLNGEYSNLDIKKYINYFTNLILFNENENDNDESIEKDKHPSLIRLTHFFSRNYEVFVQPEISNIVEDIKNILNGKNLENFEDLEFEDIEFKEISDLENRWDELIQEFSTFPLLNLNKMNYEEICNCQVYYTQNTQSYILSIFKKFLMKINEIFSENLLRFDTFILIDPSFIEIRAGEGTVAYFTDSCAFFPNSCRDEDKDFIYQVFFHEFGHYLFSLISEEKVYYWYDCYERWVKNENIKFSREEGYNEVEELFADAFSCIFADSDDFIHKPSEIIINTVKFIIDEEIKED